MRSTFFWLLSFGGFAAVSLICGLLVWPQLSAAWPSIQDKIGRFRRLPPLAKLLLLLFVGAFVVYGSTKTNLVDQTSGTNIVIGAGSLGGRISVKCAGEEVGGGVPGDAFHGNASTDMPPMVTPEDIARGWQLWEVRTNCNVSYTMPDGATLATNWWVRGAYEDVKPIDFGSWRFPFGTDEYSSLWAFTWGKLRFELGNTNTEIVAVGAPMSAVPYRSRLWSTAGANGARVVTWENFVLGRERLPAPAAESGGGTVRYGGTVNAQIELRSTGDFIARYNEVETVYRWVDPDDWDGDGWENDDDGNPYEWEGFTDYFYQELPEGANTNAYCWVEIRPKWNSWISFYGDAPSNLEDPYLWAKAGETYRVRLLIGKTYDVEGSQPFDIVAKSDERIEVMEIGANQCETVWPVEFAVAEGQAPGSRPLLGATWNDGGKSFYVLTNPYWLNGQIFWSEDSFCCGLRGDGTNFTYVCDNTCTCEGCRACGTYRYEGYALQLLGLPCGCLYVVDDGPAEIVRFEFDKAAVIYEDPYTNMPGVVVNPYPSNSTLRCVVRGGTYGGRLTVTLNGTGNAKLRCVSGDNLPNNEVIEPNTMRSFEFEYTPIAPSACANDIVALAHFVEDFLNVPHSGVASLTSVKVELTPAHVAMANPYHHRHIFGVDEFVRTTFSPSDVAGAWIDEVDVDVGADDVSFWCPWNAGIFHPTASVMGALYQTRIEIIEPVVVCRDAAWNGVVGTHGIAGNVCMNLSLYVEPDYVSFEGLSLEEIPVEGEGVHSGYFNDQDKGGSWTHTTQAGAGRWWTVDQTGFWANDEAKVIEYRAPWCDGWKRWQIPMGWGNVGTLKGRIEPNPTTQDFFITRSGTVTIQKFGHAIMRSVNNEVFFDGIQVH